MKVEIEPNDLRWIAQTAHNVYHDMTGANWDTCPKSICEFIRTTLAEAEMANFKKYGWPSLTPIIAWPSYLSGESPNNGEPVGMNTNEQPLELKTLEDTMRQRIENMRWIVPGQKPVFTSYVWPGGYSVAYICEDGELLCAECATNEETTILVPGADPQWNIVGFQTSDWFDDESDDKWECSHCHQCIYCGEDGGH